MSKAGNSNPVWAADIGSGMYQNPILHADYSDPDVCRVGDDFYMVASSFAHMPGLPILHSTDLVNWTIINHVIAKLDLPGYDRPRHGDGVWAPSIRFHDGKFWVVFSTPDEGIFMSTAVDPHGEWTPLHMIKEAKGWIDPCPFWDEDGQAYLVHAFARSRCGIKHRLVLHKMSPDGKQLLDDGVLIFDGEQDHPTMEGPKMYKRNGYYYIFAPAGGVATGWQTILRSKSIYGPYEDKIVLHQGDTPVNGPHQGGWVELDNGESWFVHFQDKDAYGRIVHLQPVQWIDDWPAMGDRIVDGKGEPVLKWKKPKSDHVAPFAVPATSDDFDEPKLGLQWQWQSNPQQAWYSLQDHPGHIRLFAAGLPEGGTTLYDAGQLLMQKFPALEFSATTKLEFKPQHEADQTGLVIFGLNYAYTAIRRDAQGQWSLNFVTGTEKDGSRVEEVTDSRAIPEGPVYLQVHIAEGAVCRFSYSLNGSDFETIGADFQAKEGRWVGAKIGIFAVNTASSSSQGYVDADWFVVK